MTAAAVLYLRAIVQTFDADETLVKYIAKQTGMVRQQRTLLAAELAAMRRSGMQVAHLMGLALAGHTMPTVVTVLPDGLAGLGVAITSEPAAELETVKALCAAESDSLPPGFSMIVFPAMVVAEGLQ